MQDYVDAFVIKVWEVHGRGWLVPDFESCVLVENVFGVRSTDWNTQGQHGSLLADDLGYLFCSGNSSKNTTALKWKKKF